ncbi:MAG: radical SAM protein, partial [Dehalococcoidia bacterium]|nr:radical SAM protein [Dehalococcoidia bacterium]
PPLGLSYLASYLSKYGGIDQIVFRRSPQDLIAEKPDIVGISSVTHNFNRAIRSAGEIRESLGVPVVVGGTHISALPHTLPSCFDAGVLGEGEETFLDLCRRYESKGRLTPDILGQIPGIVFHGEEGTLTTTVRPLIDPLDRIPPPRRDLLRESVDPSFRHDMHMLTSRGCPYRCVFCFSTQYWGRIRFFSPRRVVDEIKDLVENWGATSINLYDDLFIANRNRLKEIADLLEQEGLTGKVRLSCASARADLLDEEVCALLRRMNVQAIGFGAESGSQPVLSYLKKDTTTVEDNQRVIDLCQNYGFQLFASFIIGSPGEEEKDLVATYEFISKNASRFHAVDVYSLTPYPGTPVWQEAASRGMVSDDMDWDILAQDPQICDTSRSILLNEKLSREQFYLYFRLFQHLCREIQTGRSLSELSQTVNAQSREIAQLRETVEGFKRGRVMKLLMGAQDFGRRLGLGGPPGGAGAP